MKLVSKRQVQVLEFIHAYAVKNKMPPTYREIMTGVQINTLQCIACHILALRKKGLLQETPSRNCARSFILTDAGLNAISVGRPISVDDVTRIISNRRQTFIAKAETLDPSLVAVIQRLKDCAAVCDDLNKKIAEYAGGTR